MDNQKDNSSEVKSHEEILRLFKDLASLEAKVRNPEEFEKNLIREKTLYQKIESSLQKSKKTFEKPQSIKPAGELPRIKKEIRKQEQLIKPAIPTIQAEKKTQWFSFLKRKQKNQPELAVPTKVKQQTQKEKIPRSTFVLQLDTNGNLVGLPIKKPKPNIGKKARFFSRSKTQLGAEEQPGEEPAEGTKGKLTRIGSLFHRKSSSESSKGIGDKIKGIFRRKNKE